MRRDARRRYRAQSCTESPPDDIDWHVPGGPELGTSQSPEAHCSEVVHAPPLATAWAHVPATQLAPATHGFFSPDVSPGAGVKPKQLWPMADGAVHTRSEHRAVPAQSLSAVQLAPIANWAPQVWVLGWQARPTSQLTVAQLWPLSAYATQTAVPVPAALSPQ